MAPRRAWRVGLFCGCAVVLLSAALLFSYSSAPIREEAPPAAPVSRRPPFAQPSPPSSLQRSARRFVVAFLRYEAGELSGGVRKDLRAGAAGAFAAELLGALPRTPARGLPRARIETLRISALPGEAGRALVSGTARRGRRAESFSFLFEARRDGWRARGLGE